ncbi:hypothetical protein [Campylobacter vulpis]|uniref:hypothetical protein n=1 Tax=Campylobacter vulpis TaxID=1655500 RepID=UPI001BCEE167|nr:hypothetical protein [Campylobacter vulpis]
MITNPNSATQRIKNHLSYKLGQELIKYDTGGGGGEYPYFLNSTTLKERITKILKFTNKLPKSFHNFTIRL